MSTEYFFEIIYLLNLEFKTKIDFANNATAACFSKLNAPSERFRFLCFTVLLTYILHTVSFGDLFYHGVSSTPPPFYTIRSSFRYLVSPNRKRILPGKKKSLTRASLSSLYVGPKSTTTPGQH